MCTFAVILCLATLSAVLVLSSRLESQVTLLKGLNEDVFGALGAMDTRIKAYTDYVGYQATCAAKANEFLDDKLVNLKTMVISNAERMCAIELKKSHKRGVK